MLTKLMIATVCVTCVASVNLFIPENPLSSDIAELRVNRRSKRDAASDFMAAFYDVTIAVNGIDITGRLKRKDVIDDVALPNYIYKKDWATYTSNELDGVFIVHRHDLNSSLLNIEGYMVHERSPYLIQPHSRGHVVHLLDKPFTGSKYDFTIRQMAERVKYRSREKRVPRVQWVVELVVVSDASMRELIEKKLKKKKKIDCYIQNYYAMIVMFIDKRMETLRQQGTYIYCRGKAIYMLTSDMPGVPTRPATLGSAHRKRADPDDILDTSFHIMRGFRPYDHLMVLSGFELFSGNFAMNGLANDNSICTDDSLSTIRFDFTLGMLQTAAHEICHPMGVRHDQQRGFPLAANCLASDKYIMAPTSSNPYEMLQPVNWWHYSKCTAAMMNKYLTSLPRNRRCLDLDSTKLGGLMIKQSLFGRTMSLNKQCQFVWGDKARHEKSQNKALICSEGLHCVKKVKILKGWKRFLPYPGTPCGRRKVDSKDVN